LADIKAVAKQRAAGALCGIDATPLTVSDALSAHGAGLWILAHWAKTLTFGDWGVDGKFNDGTNGKPITGNDGLVGFQSCSLADDRVKDPRGFTAKYSAAGPEQPYYAAKVSHQDGTCFFGKDQSTDRAKQPCFWMKLRIREARAKQVGTDNHLPNWQKPSSTGPYLPFSSYVYPRSFLEQEGWMSEEQHVLLQKQEEAKQKAMHTIAANSREADKFDLNAVFEAAEASMAEVLMKAEAQLQTEAEGEEQE